VVINLSGEPVEFKPEGLDGYRGIFQRNAGERTNWEPWSFEVYVKREA